MGIQKSKRSAVSQGNTVEINLVWVVLAAVFILLAGIIINRLGTLGYREQQAIAPQEVTEIKGYPLFVKVDLNKGHLLGDLQNAKVVLIEFSDFACPVCQHFAVEYFPRFKKELIDTGTMAYIGRYYIAVPSHKPTGELAINFVECVKQSTPDVDVFSLKSEIYKYYKEQGSGLTVDKAKDYLLKLAQHIKVGDEVARSCLDRMEYLGSFREDTEYIDNYVAKLTLPSSYKELMQIKSYVTTFGQIGIGTPFYVVCPARTVDMQAMECTGLPILGLLQYDQFKRIITDLAVK